MVQSSAYVTRFIVWCLLCPNSRVCGFGSFAGCVSGQQTQRYAQAADAGRSVVWNALLLAGSLYWRRHEWRGRCPQLFIPRVSQTTAGVVASCRIYRHFYRSRYSYVAWAAEFTADVCLDHRNNRLLAIQPTSYPVVRTYLASVMDCVQSSRGVIRRHSGGSVCAFFNSGWCLPV